MVRSSLLVGEVSAVAWLAFAWRSFSAPAPLSWAGIAWFLIAAGAALGVLLKARRAALAAWPEARCELLRWVVLGAGATALFLPFYRRDALGSGDAQWYTMMLADFIEQVHRGVFPVWVGQSIYAFNGAVTPLRIAPWFQYMAALLDLATAHALAPTALKNALLCVNALAMAASAYVALRSVLSRRPNLAAALALLWIASPGVLAPLYVGDQYMAFMAMPFIPALFSGCVRLWDNDLSSGARRIAIALAGLLLSHAPTALWGSLLAVGMLAARAATAKPAVSELRGLARAAGWFAILGAFPAASALTIDQPNPARASGSMAYDQLARCFPANVKPIDVHGSGFAAYQPGYALGAIALAAVAFLLLRRPRAWIAFLAAIALPLLLFFPVPGIARSFWVHAPPLLLTVTNIWPTQRIFAIWGLASIFGLAVALRTPAALPALRIPGPVGVALAALFFIGAGAWSGMEASKLNREIMTSVLGDSRTRLLFSPENCNMSRYAYGSFATVPAYASHGYTDPLLENRIISRETGEVVTANADAAAPRPRPGGEPETLPRLVLSGTWTGQRDNGSLIYNFSPPLPIRDGRRYALRLEFLRPENDGVLQIFGDGLVREYLLPDSGVGLDMKEPSKAFGALPSGARVIPIRRSLSNGKPPISRFVAARSLGENADFARYWLFSYDKGDLPVRVTSWIPYRADADTAIPAYLETPRVWQRGWRAEVNGRPAAVLPSPRHLAMIPIGPGSSSVKLFFAAPWWLGALFWACLIGWLWIAGSAGCRRLGPRAPV